MLWMFASRNEKTSRAVRHARTLKIRRISAKNFHWEFLPILQHDEPESQDPSPSSPSLIRRLAFAISSLKHRVK